MTALRSFHVQYVTENRRTGRRNMLREDIFAESVSEVRQSIATKGGHVVHVKERRAGRIAKAFFSGLRLQISILRQLVNYITLRQSPARAMQALVSSQSSGRRLQMTPASETLARGGTLAQALRELKLYKEPIVRLIEAGERTNTVRDAINHAIALLESQRKLANQLYAAIGWIVVDILATISSISYLHLSFLPDMAAQGIQTANHALRADFDMALHTAIIINGLLFYGQFAIAFGGYGLFLLYSSRDKYGGKVIDKIERIPVLRRYLLDTSLAQSFGALSRILKAGMHLPAALAIAAQSANCMAVARMLRNAKTRIEQGDSIASALDHKVLSHAEHSELQNQTSSDSIADACGRIAEARGEATKASNRRLITATVTLSIVYGSLSALTFLWVMVIQNKAQMESLNSIGVQ